MSAKDTQVTNVDVTPEMTDESGEGANAEVPPIEPELESLPLDQVFDILKNKRRRTVLRYLDEHENPVSLGELSEHVAADENDKPIAQISSRERKCAYVGLYQCHLPKMDSMDVIDFNQNRGLIETGPNAEQLKQYLDWSDEPTRPWPVYYGMISVTGLAVGLATGALIGSTTSIAVYVVVLLAIAGVAVAHLHTEGRNRNSETGST